MTVDRGPKINQSPPSYDRTYSSQTERFKHTVTFEVLQHLKNSLGTCPSTCLDIGCGQGQVLDYAYRELAPTKAEPQAFVGVDMSEVGIQQANERNPQLTWVIDSYQDFASYGLHYTGGTGYSLIINKGGLTFIDSESQYRDLMTSTRDLLAEGGLYLFIQNKNFYDQWMGNRAGKWSQDAIDIAVSTFGNPLIIPNDSYHALAFGSNLSGKQPYPPFIAQDDPPQAITLNFDQGLERHFVSHSEQRLLKLTRYFDFDWPAYIRQQMTAKGTEPSGKVWDLLERYNSRNPDVILPRATIRIALDSKIDITQQTLTLVSESLDCAFYPFRITNSRILVKRLDSILAALPVMVILGLSMEDHAINEPFDQALVDIDEFETRLDYVFRTVTNQGIRALYVLPNSDLEGKEEQRGLRWTPSLTQEYRECVSTLASQYDISTVDLLASPSNSAISESKWDVATKLAKEVFHERGIDLA